MDWSHCARPFFKQVKFLSATKKRNLCFKVAYFPMSLIMKRLGETLTDVERSTPWTYFRFHLLLWASHCPIWQLNLSSSHIAQASRARSLSGPQCATYGSPVPVSAGFLLSTTDSIRENYNDQALIPATA